MEDLARRHACALSLLIVADVIVALSRLARFLSCSLNTQLAAHDAFDEKGGCVDKPREDKQKVLSTSP